MVITSVVSTVLINNRQMIPGHLIYSNRRHHLYYHILCHPRIRLQKQLQIANYDALCHEAYLQSVNVHFILLSNIYTSDGMLYQHLVIL